MRILDLFCGAGGASVGLHRAFPAAEIIGVDVEAQPRYPFTFIQADAMTFPLEGFDFIWASPPCQRFSTMSSCRPGLAMEYPDFVAATRERLQRTGVPYTIENVVGAPLLRPITLCGQMFKLPLYRHRLFECSFAVPVPGHPRHLIPTSKAGHWEPGTIISVAGHCAPMAMARTAMGIAWMNRAELTEAIPPAYSAHVALALADLLAVVEPK